MMVRSLAGIVLAVIFAAICAAADLPSSPGEFLMLLDRDGDGRIDVREYQVHLSRGFHAMDRNGDAVVDPHELPPGTANGRSKPLTLARHQNRIADTFRRQDIDHNGYLDVQELAGPPR